MPAADLHIADLNDHILGVELPVAAFKGLGYALYRINDIKAADQIDIDAGHITDQTDNRLKLTVRDMQTQALSLQPVHQLDLLFFRNPVF